MGTDRGPGPDVVEDTPEPDTGEDVPMPPMDTMCPMGETACGSTCANLQTDSSNCGSCGNACMAGQVCRMGACTMPPMCMMGEMDCGGTCVNTSTNAMNCGSCGNACPAGQTCQMGVCAAPPMCMMGETACGATCVNLQTDNNNCGACGTVCPMGQGCMAGMCRPVTMCMPGQTACGGVCVNTQTDAMNCGSCGTACMPGQTCNAGVCTMMMCPPGQTLCGTSCVNLQTDATNCGMCGRACAAGQMCVAGMCGMTVVCPPGQTNCGGVCVNTQTDPTNCGACGMACPAGQMCQMGVCRAVMMCPMGQILCGTSCVNAQTDPANCGICGNRCPTGQTCNAGVCGCPTGTTACGGMCVNTQTSPTNCGACGTVCGTGQTCVGGVCTCPAGQMNCMGTCRATQTDVNNCGMCGRVCPAGQVCNAGMCACPTGTMLCGTTCVNLQTSSTNCGMCGRVCMGGQVCNAGMCACPTGQTNCSGTCRALQTDPLNCGMCGRMCAAGQICMAGACTGGTPPPNDTRAGATVINLGSGAAINLMTDTRTARNNTTGTCGCTGGQDVFYTFTLTRPEIVYADTIGATWDTSLFLQTAAGTNITDAMLPGGAACNDDNGLGCTSGLQSMIAARLNPGQYYLVLSGCGTGPATIHFHHLPVGNGPVARLTPSAMTQMVSGTTAGTGLVTSACCSGGPENTYWWPSCPGFMATPFSASTCGGATFDTELDQRSALRGGTASVCNDDSCGLQSIVNSTIPAGPGLNTLYLDSCTGSGAYTVRFTMGTCPAGQTLCGGCVNLQTDNNNCGACGRVCGGGTFCNAGACVTPPANDLRAGATVINLASPAQLLMADTTNARNHTTGTCGCTGGNDVFFRFQLTRPELVYADTIGTAWDTSLFLQDGAGNNIVNANAPGGTTCNDDGGLAGCSTGLQSQVLARLAAGTYYLVLSGCGRGTAQIRFHHLPVGNGTLEFLAAGAGQTRMGTTGGAGTVTGSCASNGPENTYFWWTCGTSAGGSFTATTCMRATWDTSLHQFSAVRNTSVCNDDVGGACGQRSSIAATIPAGPGLHTFYVDGFSATSFGTYSVLVTRP